MENKPLGMVMIDLEQPFLTSDDRQRLLLDNCCGVVLFDRNFKTKGQLKRLCYEIKKLRSPSLMIAVDQEGGRVQRFKDGFTTIPPMRKVGNLWENNRQRALEISEMIGVVISTEIRECGVDFSFTPVLDLDYQKSHVIGDRAFHSSPEVVSELSLGLVRGLYKAGGIAVGKHFPGHGYATKDSHTEIVEDLRSLPEIEKYDMYPFSVLIGDGLHGVMPAHITFPRVENKPVGFSNIWLQKILRGKLKFNGVVFSDDLSMSGAQAAESIETSGADALDAGCDILLLCNNAENAQKLLRANLTKHKAQSSTKRIRDLRLLLDRNIPEESLALNYEIARKAIKMF